MQRRLLLLDFFGVICSEIAPYWLGKHFSADDAIKVKGDVVHLADAGAISQDRMLEILGNMVRLPPEIILEEWNSLATIDQEMVDLVSELSRTYRVALLTNSPSPFVRGVLAKFNLEAMFEKIIVSSEVKLAKPDPEIFRLSLDSLDVSADETLFVDDNPANVATAQNLGIRAIRFTSATDFRADIASMIWS